MLTDVDEFYHPGVGSHRIAKQEAWSDCFLCDELDHITVEWLKLKRGGTARCSMMHTVREHKSNYYHLKKVILKNVLTHYMA
jgi:hypothetical protein